MHVYDCKEKQVGREEVYACLEAEAGGRLLLFPGPRRHEIDTAVRHGFSVDKMILVEQNNAVKANLTRQFGEKERGAVQAALRQGWLSDVCEDLAREGVLLDAVHLDFCEPIETLQIRSPRVEIERFIKSGVMKNGLLAVTVLNGRVANYTGEEIRLKLVRHAVSGMFEGIVEQITFGTYWNPVKCSPMLWVVYRLESKAGVRNWWKN